MSGSAVPSGGSRAICSPTRRVRLRTVPALMAPPTGSSSASRSATFAKGASAANLAVT